IDMCRGLDYAFQRGVSHRDLKASNVLLSSLGQAKLLDFGLAGQDVDDSDNDSDKIENQRTVDYTALEKSTGVPRDDSRSDIFFLGCIYYQMLCGKPALEETQDRRARMGRERFDAMVPIGKVMPELSPEAAGVVNKSVTLDPERRYQTPGEMLRELLALAEFLASGHATNGKVRKAGAAMLKQRTVMIVEPNAQVQEALRTHFKQEGFRVLVTADSHRPASMFTESSTPADCVIFSTSSLGEEALSAFNDFGEMPATKQLPAILLLGPRHLNWADRAKTNDRRMTVATPIKMKRLLAQLEQMIPTKTG
ncbi:MAG TPA: protein kinase, partial [Pirellulales bacterium]